MSARQRSARRCERLTVGMPVLMLAFSAAVALVLTLAATPVLAAGAYWRLASRAAPSVLPLEGEQLAGEDDQGVKGEGMLIVTATNLGGVNVNGEATPVTITDELPPGLEAVAVHGESGKGIPGEQGTYVLQCTSALPASEVSCSFPKQLPPYEVLTVEVTVRSLATSPMRATGHVAVSGGSTPPAAIEQPVDIAGGPTGFGVESYELRPETENGELDLQAGSHPFQLTSTFDLNQDYGLEPESTTAYPQAPALQKELQVKLPAGFIGDPAAAPQCSDEQFGARVAGELNACPDDTAIGVAAVTFNDPIFIGFQTWTVPVFNLTPAPGQPARFGFSIVHVPVLLDASVRTGEDYGVTVTVHNASEGVQILGAQVTLWGAPEDPSHDAARGWGCLGSGNWVAGQRPCEPPSTSTPEAFLTLPTTCTPLQSSITGSSWSGETLAAEDDAGTLTGCQELEFKPSLAVSPDQHAASTPTGMRIELGMPQEGTLDPAGRAEQDIRETTLMLPEGLEVNPGAANGLEACTAAQLGFNEPANGGYQPGLPETEQTQNNDFSPTLPEASELLPEPPCPQPSKLGTLEIQTPLLPNPLTGGVYLAAQDTDPFASPLVLYLVAEEPVSKVIVKLAGTLHIAETGQLTSTFTNTPPLPFTRLVLHLFAEHAAQSTPSFCGEYHASAKLTPWDANPPTEISSDPQEFQITTGPQGTPCPQETLPFAPALKAGSTNPQAGALTSFQLELERPDGQQPLTGVEVHLPPGLAALISTVSPCPEPPPSQEWACGQESLIGHSTASSGLGGQPVTLPGEVFLTSGYDGAPFGILVRTHAAVGPFDLGWVDVRSRINVNPETAAVTITTDPGPHHDRLPTMLKGVPVQLKQLTVTVDRPGFEFNPTSCNPSTITATLTGAEGASAAPTAHYQPHGCNTLPFHPILTASVGGHASKKDGASLTVKITSQGLGQANIRKVDLQLPEALPSRQETLNKACLAAVFEANPSGCSEGSVIGYATVHTPILRSVLTGPAYLVSHGGGAFPDVEFVLQGEGVTLILDGKTDIHDGITYSRFEAAPDEPFTSFETVLPAGPHSILGAYASSKEPEDLCQAKLQMPTTITAQDGARIQQTTQITPTGCAGVLASKTKLTRTQQLAKALKACKRHQKKSKRTACERAARKKYAAHASKRRRRSSKATKTAKRR